MADTQTKEPSLQMNAIPEASTQLNGEGQPNNKVTTPTPALKEQWLSSFFGKIGKQLEDITYLEVLTTGADTSKLRLTKEKPEIDDALMDLGEVSILARTRIELDGDIAVLLPLKGSTEEASINNEIMDVHRENVKVALENWRGFMNAAIEAAKTVAVIAGYSNVGKAFDNFMYKDGKTSS
jgi:hypothetical protein